LGFKGNNREICLATASHEVQSVGWQAGTDEEDIETFRNYSDVAGARYPKNFALLKNGKQTISASVVTLETASFDPALLIPPKGAVERRKCAGITPPHSITRPKPDFGPRVADGSVSAEITVLADGSVGDVQIMSASNTAIHQSAIEMFRKFKFAPAMCGTDPVIAEVEERVTFHRN
jgi:TonB family protein